MDESEGHFFPNELFGVAAAKSGRLRSRYVDYSIKYVTIAQVSSLFRSPSPFRPPDSMAFEDESESDQKTKFEMKSAGLAAFTRESIKVQAPNIFFRILYK